MELKLRMTAVGGAGTSTVTAQTEAPIKGWIESIAVKYNSAAATTVLTITEADNFLNSAIITTPAGNTDTVFYATHPVVNLTGAAVTNSWMQHFVQYPIKVVVTAANNNDIIEVHFYLSNEFWV